MPSKHSQSLKSTYADIATGYQQVHGEDLRGSSLEEFLSLCSHQSHILDLGCGPGRDSRWFVDNGCTVTMFDLSPAFLKLAHALVPEATAVEGDMTDLPFPPHSFDGIWASASLLHLTKQEIVTVFSKLHQILKPNGILFFSLKIGTGEQIVAEAKYGKPMRRFFSFYTPEEIKPLLEMNQFSLINEQVIPTKTTKWLQVLARA